MEPTYTWTPESRTVAQTCDICGTRVTDTAQHTLWHQGGAVPEQPPRPPQVGDPQSDLERAVFEAIGAASVCWSELPTGVFESERAEEIGKNLLNLILGDREQEERTFKQELAEVINRHSMEGNSDTPDFVLADFLGDCLAGFEYAVRQRNRWYGRKEGPE
jgi:hypothetical protein